MVITKMVLKNEIDSLDDQAMSILYHFIQTLKPSVNKTSLTQYYDWLKEDETDLHELEKRYGLSSVEFYQKFQQGILQQTVEFVTWAQLFESSERLRSQIKGLESGQTLELPLFAETAGMWAGYDIDLAQIRRQAWPRQTL